MRIVSIRSIRLVAAALAVIRGVASAATVTGATTVLIDPREPVALQKAAADLVSDLSEVFGRPLRLVNEIKAAAPVTICVCLSWNLPPSVVPPSGSEALEIRVTRNPWPGRNVREAILLTGADARGAIYAVYQFSQQFLGVDPMYYWTDHAPRRRSSLQIPEDTAIRSAPAFRYRGWFLNDEDLLTGWRPGTADGTGIALAVWDKIFETILRLKGNMVVPGTFVFPGEPQVKAAGERGLMITQHHIEVVGTNTYRWPDDQPYSFAARPDLLISAWTKAVEGYAAGQEVIWTLGYRGRHDRPFWSDDKSVGESDQERAALIRRAMDRQMEIVRARKKQPYFLMNAWQEAVPFLRKGVLRIPDGVTLVWPDNGHGLIEDGGAITRGQGVYYHTAMYNSKANQLTEAVPLERIQRELGRAARAGATEYLLVNTSDVRPVPMTTRAVMELAWNPAPWMAGSEAADYLRKWSAEEFGSRAASAVEDCYRAYFAAPGRYGTGEEQTFADNAYFTFARGLLVSELTGRPSLPTRYFARSTDYEGALRTMADAARQAVPAWDRARELADRAAPLIPADRRTFFQAHVRTQLDIHRYGNRMLLDLLESRNAGPIGARRAKVASAIENIESVLRSLRAAEYGPWAGFYEGDLFVAVRHTLALARGYDLKLQGEPLPENLPLQLLPVDPYVRIKAYQGSRRVPL
jgi:hypothetical protein